MVPCLSSVIPVQLQSVYLTELFQGGDVLQDHFGKGPLHEVGVHGVGRQHSFVGLHTRLQRSV